MRECIVPWEVSIVRVFKDKGALLRQGRLLILVLLVSSALKLDFNNCVLNIVDTLLYT